MSQTLLSNGLHHFKVIVCKLTVGFIDRGEASEKKIMQTVFNSSYFMCSKLFLQWSKMVF
jgi:hypothetical protein